MREYLKNPDFIAKRIEKRAENKKELQKFFIHIGPTLRVCRDKYNINLIEKRTSEDGNPYITAVGHFSTPTEVLPKAALEKGAEQKDVEAYLKKVQGIKVAYSDGKLVMKIPNGFESDPVDINFDEE
jgi:hypothetical protein